MSIYNNNKATSKQLWLIKQQYKKLGITDAQRQYNMTLAMCGKDNITKVRDMTTKRASWIIQTLIQMNNELENERKKDGLAK